MRIGFAMHSFSQKIIDLEARINRLKTLGMRGSSTFATTSKTITIPMEIVSDGMGGSESKYSARITVSPEEDNCLVCAYIQSPQNFSGRNFVLDRRTDSSYEHQFVFQIKYGSETDTAIINGGGTIPPFNVVIEVVATSNFTLSYVLTQEN